MFDGALNVHLGGYLLKVYDPKLNVIHEVKHTVYLLFNDASKNQF